MAVDMTGPFRPLFGPFRTESLAEGASNGPESAQNEQTPNSALCPKARYKVAYKQLAPETPTESAEENPRLEMAHSQSSGDEQSEKDKGTPAAISSPAESESGGEREMKIPLEGVAQKQEDAAGNDKAQTELSLVAGFTDSLSGFLRSEFQDKSLQAGDAVKPIPQSADSMHALLASLNESLPAFPAPTSVPAADELATNDSAAIDFTAFPLPSPQGDSMPSFRDFFSQQNSQPPAVHSPAGVADHRFFQPVAQKSKLVPRRGAAAEPPAGATCSEKRKADWDEPGTAGAHDESEDMETDGERGSDKAGHERKSQRCAARTEEQRMKDRAKAKRHRQRKKVQEANDKATICHLEAEVEKLRRALKVSEEAQAESQKVVGTLEKEVELWKTAYRDLGKTMSDMLKVGGSGVAAKAPSS